MTGRGSPIPRLASAFQSLGANHPRYTPGLVKLGTTLAIPAEAFTDLHRGPIFHERLKGAPACPDTCLHQDNLKPCPAACECAYVREVLDRVAHWPKQPL